MPSMLSNQPPTPRQYGFCSVDEKPCRWTIEGGEAAYNAALKSFEEATKKAMFETAHKALQQKVKGWRLSGFCVDFKDELDQKYESAHRAGIQEFCESFHVRRNAFAAEYGCSPSYLSQILSGNRTASVARLSVAFLSFGVTPHFDVVEFKWSFQKINFSQ